MKLKKFKKIIDKLMLYKNKYTSRKITVSKIILVLSKKTLN